MSGQFLFFKESYAKSYLWGRYYCRPGSGIHWEINIMQENKIIRVVTIQMDLAIPTDDYHCVSKEDICNYLNIKMYEDPEFFGEFGPENILRVGTLES